MFGISAVIIISLIQYDLEQFDRCSQMMYAGIFALRKYK